MHQSESCSWSYNQFDCLKKSNINKCPWYCTNKEQVTVTELITIITMQALITLKRVFYHFSLTIENKLVDLINFIVVRLVWLCQKETIAITLLVIKMNFVTNKPSFLVINPILSRKNIYQVTELPAFTWSYALFAVVGDHYRVLRLTELNDGLFGCVIICKVPKCLKNSTKERWSYQNRHRSPC